MTVRFLPVALAVGLALQAAAASAATPIDQTRPLAADGRISVSNVSGRISVHTWDKPQARITGSLGKGVEKLVVEGDGKYLRIEVKYPDSKGRWFGFGGRQVHTEPSIIEVMVPRRASVALEAVSADVDVDGVHGRRLEIDSVSGDVKVTGSAPGEGRFENVSGDLDLLLDTPQVSAESVSGDLLLRGALTGEVEVESVSGNIIVASTRLRRLAVSSVSGDADLRIGLDAGGSVTADTVSGTLKLVLPAGTGARLHAESFSGYIRSPVGHVDEEDHGPGSSLDARLGDGKGEVRMESFSGDIVIQTK
jgi:DUF4097 and DUF4098 domain-containing protein YvlB